MTLQPGFQGLDHRVEGTLEAADRVTEAALWVGCHPGLSPPMIDWIAECVTNWAEQR
jgi:dTDP-4-amino-4,6-dideoxygalactose transaminase